MRIPVLETERLTIRELEQTDLHDTHRILCEAFQETLPLEERREWLDWTIMSYKAYDGLAQPNYGERAIVRKQDNRLVGAVGLVPALGPFGQLPYFTALNGQEDRFFHPEFGLFWAVDPACHRQGYATEAANALVDHLFKHMNLRRIIATTEYDNEGSMGVMKRLGMNIQKNPYPDPVWFQVVGVLENPLKGN